MIEVIWGSVWLLPFTAAVRPRPWSVDARNDVRQLTDVSGCNLQHCFPGNLRRAGLYLFSSSEQITNAHVSQRAGARVLSGASKEEVLATDDVQHHVAPEIVINRDPLCPPDKRIMLVDDYGHRIELSVEQLRRMAEEVLSPRFFR